MFLKQKRKFHLRQSVLHIADVYGMASEINIYSFFSDIQKNYSGYPKKNLWYLKYWHINFRYLKKNSRYQK